MVTMVSHIACGNDSMLSRGSTRNISAAKNNVSSMRENNKMGNASKACSQAAITKRKRSKRRRVFSVRIAGTMQRRMSRARPREPPTSLFGKTKPMAARRARGATARKSIALCKLERKMRRLGQERKANANSKAKMASNTVSRIAASTPPNTSISAVCISVVITERIVRAGMKIAYQDAALLESGLDKRFHTATKMSARLAWASNTWQLVCERLSTLPLRSVGASGTWTLPWVESDSLSSFCSTDIVDFLEKLLPKANLMPPFNILFLGEFDASVSVSMSTISTHGGMVAGAKGAEGCGGQEPRPSFEVSRSSSRLCCSHGGAETPPLSLDGKRTSLRSPENVLRSRRAAAGAQSEAAVFCLRKV
mmetsp:Transcript_85307/g.236381  ORF Transcript_85307/g.236381 Transcript_85307/m.236381 type:complete len:365 (+) Transcript_85307:814-1908(+)